MTFLLMNLYGEIKAVTIGYARVATPVSEQELPVGFQLPDPYADHPANLAREKFIQTEADLPCSHYPHRSRYYCALCTYEFTEKYIREGEDE